MSQDLVWEPEALRDLEKETIYLRERLRQRVENFVRDAGDPAVTLDHVLRVRRMPTGMPVRMETLGAVEIAEPEAPSWPVTFGVYALGDPDGSIAICTLASQVLIDELAALSLSGVAIIGRIFTENFGVEKLVTNFVANPNLRTLILCGTESRHQVGQTLLALHANGRDADGRVIGSESPQPLVRSLSDEAVEIYRRKGVVVDARGEQSVEAIQAHAADALKAQREPWQDSWKPDVQTIHGMGAFSRGMGGRFTPDPTGLFLIGIGPWKDTIEVEHYTREGILDRRLLGETAEQLTRAIVGNNLIGDSGHALYVGRELQKAELSLKAGLHYEQDRDITLG